MEIFSLNDQKSKKKKEKAKHSNGGANTPRSP